MTEECMHGKCARHQLLYVGEPDLNARTGGENQGGVVFHLLIWWVSAIPFLRLKGLVEDRHECGEGLAEAACNSNNTSVDRRVLHVCHKFRRLYC